MLVDGGEGVLPISGVLAKRANLMTQVSGMTSMQMAGRDFKEAMASPGVQGVVLLIDSPGGTVDGTEELAAIIAAARGVKPVITLADGTMASAAVWIGLQSDAVYVTSETTQVGSIGVVTSHTDVSGRQAADGIKTTEITAGKYKRIASQYEPLSDAGRAEIQSKVDYLYSLFVAAVAKARGVSEETVLEKMADGRVFIGRQAIDAGLVDGVSTLEGAIAEIKQRAAGVAAPRAKQPGKTPLAGGETMDRDSILAQAPELAAAFRAEGAEAERQRILDVEAQAMPGHEALIAEMKADGKTTGPEAAQRILAAEKTRLASMAEKIRAEAPAPVLHATAPEAEAPAKPRTRQELHERAKAYQAEHPGTDYQAALRAVA